MKKDKDQELKMRPLKNNVVHIIISILHEDTEAQRQDQLICRALCKMKMQGPLFKNH